MNYIKYPLYKKSTISWIEEVPSHWEIRKLKEKILHSNSGEVINRNYWGGNHSLLYTCAKKPFLCDFKSFPNNKRTGIGDLLLSRNGTPYVHKPPIGSIYSNVVQRIQLSDPKERDYLALALQSSMDNINSQGVSIDSINLELWEQLSLPIPPLNEQIIIYRYLKEKVNQLNRLIDKKARYLDLLREKRLSNIHDLITKGLSSSNTMKQSGFRWFGKIPSDWIVTKAKYVSHIFIPQRRKPILNSGGQGYPWFTINSILNDFSTCSSLWVSEQEVKKSKARVLPKGSVIASCIGRFSLASETAVDSVINQQLQAFIPFDNLEPSYLAKLISISSDYFKSICTVSTVPYVNQNGFKNLPIILPSKAEQIMIVNALDKLLIDYQQEEELLLKAIRLYKEKITTLIFSVITGQVDVR